LLEQDIATGALSLPPEDDQASMFLEGSARLTSQGYDHYEISNYCLPGKHSRHNTGYWEGKEYLGVGPGAVSTISSNRWTNPANLTAYTSALKHRELDADREFLAPATLNNERIMLALRTSKGLNLDMIQAGAPNNLAHNPAYPIEALCRQGLAYTVGTSLCLTTKGMLVSNDIISEFLFPQDIDQKG
jgi:oxygen-independent coproporphyrinogen-3 oxidase